jgi:polysaccharide biosynthesis transport protein
MHALPTAPNSMALRSDEPEGTRSVHSFLDTFAERWRVFAAIALGVLFLDLVFTLIAPKTYTSTVKLIAGNPAGTPSTGESQNDNGASTNLPILNALLVASGVQSSETYAELFQEDPIARAVIDDMKLNMTPAGLLGHVKVAPVTNTNILAVAVTWGNRSMSAAVANDIAKDFVARERDLVAGQATEAIDFLSKQLPDAESKLRDAESALAQFEASHHIADVNSQTQGLIQSIANVDAKSDQVQLDQRQAEAQIASISGQLARMSPTANGGNTVAPNPILAQLKQQLAQTQVQLRTAQQQYTDQYPAVIALKQQIAQLDHEIAGQPATIVSGTNTVANPVYEQLNQQLAVARAQQSGDAAQLQQLQQQRGKLDPQLAALPSTTAQLANLQRQQKLAEAVYTAEQQKYNDAMVTKTTALSDVTITQPADPADAQVSPNIGLNLAIGLIVAIVLGLTGVLVVDFFDSSIKNEREVERELALPVLASIPALPPEGRSVTKDVQYLMVESFLQLVTSMRYASDKPLRTIAITSPLKGDGKSTIAINVGKALGELLAATPAPPAEGNGPLLAPGDGVPAKILLLDADLRRPSLHHKLGLSNRPGLSDILVGRAKFEDAVQPTKYPGLDVLSSGTISPNPIKLLQSANFDLVMEEAMKRYATILIDAPAMLPVFDAAVLSAKADGTILVVSAGRTDMRATKRALQRLDQVGVRDFIGVVINRSKSSMQDYMDYIGMLPNEPKVLKAS